jgi:NADPH:quinone reductase-like Zn-dependent oxidoreductase
VKAVVLSRYGSPADLALEEVDVPAPKAGEVLVEVGAIREGETVLINGAGGGVGALGL